MEAGTLAPGAAQTEPDSDPMAGAQERLFPVSGTLLSLTQTGSLPIDDLELERGDVIELHVRAVVRHTGETDEVDSKTQQVVDAKRVVKAAVVGHEVLRDED